MSLDLEWFDVLEVLMFLFDVVHESLSDLIDNVIDMTSSSNSIDGVHKRNLIQLPIRVGYCYIPSTTI